MRAGLRRLQRQRWPPAERRPRHDGFGSDGSLSRAIFRDGHEHATCRTSPAAAFTGPGSRVVFVCGNRFGTIGRERAELVMIHELLHTLGLGEQPPTSGEINRIVARRCRS
jgi:hypothetical protein